MMVLKDPTDWFRDLQLILDVVTSSAFNRRSMTRNDRRLPVSVGFELWLVCTEI